MKRFLQFSMLVLLSVGLTGCFIFTSSSKSSQTTSSDQTTTVKRTTADILAKRWKGLRVYRESNGKQFESRQLSSKWMQFYSNGTCYENGFIGTDGKQQLRWTLSGSKLTIKGKNLTFADGNLSDDKIVYDIVSISDTQLHLSRWDGRQQDGTNITRHILLYY